MSTGPTQSRRAPIGVLVMAYGTPSRSADIEAYYTDIRRGRPPTAEQLADLVCRYDAIGGVSPLTARTESQRVAIAEALERSSPGRFEVVTGMRHVAPSIEDGMATLADRGATRVVGLVLAPHYSSMSVATYLGRASAAANEHGVEFVGIDRWGTMPAYVDFLAGEVRNRLASMPVNTKVVFTAHSLPQRILTSGDPYPDELRATAQAVAERAGLARWTAWSVAWQSAGRTPEPWIGPDILTVVDELAAASEGGSEREGAAGLLVCPCGFVADHLEVLYDLDIEARLRAEQAGLVFARTPSMNDDPAVTAALAELVATAAR